MVPLQYCLCFTARRTAQRFIQVMKQSRGPLYLFTSALFAQHVSDSFMSVNDREWSLGVSDSLLSHKECFQSIPTSTGTKHASDFHSPEITEANSWAAPTKEKAPLLALAQVTREAKGQSCWMLFQIPGCVPAALLFDKWGGTLTLR